MPAPWFPEPSASDAAVTALVDKLESPMFPLSEGIVVPLALFWGASTSPATAPPFSPSSISDTAALSIPFFALPTSVGAVVGFSLGPVALVFSFSPGLLPAGALESSPTPSGFGAEASTAAPLFFLAFFLLGSETPVPGLTVDGVAVEGSGRF